MGKVIIRQAKQDDFNIIDFYFMQKKDEFFNHKVNKHKARLTIHQSIHQDLCTMMYQDSIPMGYALGIKAEDFWNYDKNIYLASVYIFKEFRRTRDAIKMILFWAKNAKKHGKVIWAKKLESGQ